MNYKSKILSTAGDELISAALWYDKIRTGLGDEVILCFEATVDTILSNPFSFQLRHKNIRIANLYRFPYQVVYYLEKSTVMIISFHHHKQKPQRWRKRKK